MKKINYELKKKNEMMTDIYKNVIKKIMKIARVFFQEIKTKFIIKIITNIIIDS